MVISIFLSVLEISMSVGLTVIILILLSPLLYKRYAVKWKYLIWIFLALRLLIPFRGITGQSVLDMLLQGNIQTASESDQNNGGAPTDETLVPRRIIVEIPTQMTTPIMAQSGNNSIDLTMLDVMVFVWISGSLIFISVHFASYFHCKRQLVKKGEIVEDVHILSQVFKLKRELHIRGTVRVIEYYEGESPMIIGFLKPVLILPKEQYSAEELYFILKHELVHLKRRDVYLKLLFVTANAVHWFNPLIWIMQKEAVIDMELSCDERVTQGADYAMRKAYTETLLSMLHRQYDRRTTLSTQFYEGSKIMKKRFKNILTKKAKKNGIPILICAVILSIGFGTLVGCSNLKENTKKENMAREDTESISEQPEEEAVQTEPSPVDHSSIENDTLENTTVLIFSKEGEQEEKQAVLATGNGYSVYLPEGEWYQSDSDTWTAAVNEQVRFWVTCYQNESIDSVDQTLEDDSYVTEENYHKWKQEGDLLYHVELKEFENNVWGIFYSYPSDAEEGFGRELPVIVNTFALSIEANDVDNEER